MSSMILHAGGISHQAFCTLAALEPLLMQVLDTETRKAQSGALIAGQEHSNRMQHCQVCLKQNRFDYTESL